MADGQSVTEAVVETFELRPGGLFIVPEGVNIQRSYNHGEHPDTPKIVKIFKGRDGVFYSKEPSGLILAKSFGVFVPEDAKIGDGLIISWVEENCACAVYPGN